jgi:glycosyltransferase involved in cell wall biosynthesis
MEPERIVVINDASAARGGATGLALLSVRLLRARGLAVTYVCGDGGENDELAALGVEVVALGQGRLLERGRLEAMRAGLWNRAAAQMLSGWMARNDSPRTVYHLHGWAQILSPAVFSALAPVSRRTVVHAHDFFLACPNGVYMDFQRMQPCRRVPLSAACLATHCDKRSRPEKGWRVLRHAGLRRAFASGRWAAVAMIHPGMAEPLTRAGVPARLLTTLRNPAEASGAARVRAEENDRIVFVGRLSEEKGPLDLARATAALGLPVTFVGAGPLEAEVRRLNPAAEITGWQDRAGVARHLCRARALAMPSRLPEPFGLAAAEAARAGVPVVLPDIALMAAEIAGQGMGLAYDANDSHGLESALGRIRDAGAEEMSRTSRRAGEGAGRLATTPDEWADGLVSLYRAALAPRAAHRATSPAA